MKKNVAFAAAILFLCFALAEGGLRLAGFRGAPAPFYEPAPGRQGHRIRPNMRRGDQYDCFIRTNSLGLRGDDIPKTKEPGEFRIAALGDSIVFGVGLDEKDSIPALLQKELRRRNPARNVRAINAGQMGYNTEQELAQLENDVLPLKPDLVILFFAENDLLPSQTDSVLPRKPSPLKNALKKSAAVNLAAKAAFQWKMKGRKGIWKNNAYESKLDRALGPGGGAANDGADAALEIAGQWTERMGQIEKTAALARNNGARFLLAALPSRRQASMDYLEDLRDNPLLVSPQEALRRLAARRGWLFFDPLPRFAEKENAQNRLFMDYCHLTAEGTRLMARELAAALEELE